MFLIDKYAPTNAETAFFHKDKLELLKHMANDEAIPHIIFYGPEGSGKKTIIRLFLEMLFDSNVNKTKLVPYPVTGSGNKTIFEKVKQSDYHIVIDPKNNNFDRYLLHDIVKEYAKRRPLNVYNTNRAFKVVLINNTDNMSYYAQTSLRRTMERYNDKCRFIMWCNSLSKIILPLQSRCICIRLPAPTDDQLFDHILRVSVKEQLDLTLLNYVNIIRNANGNIKTALWALDNFKFGYMNQTEYMESLDKLIDVLLKPDLINIMDIRQMLSSLMITNIDKSTIMKDLIDKICMCPKVSNISKQLIVAESVEFEYGLIKGRREILQFDPLISFILLTFAQHNPKPKIPKKKK